MGSHIVEHVKAHVAQVIIAIVLTIGVPVVIHLWQMHKLGPPKPMFPNLPAPSLTGHTNLHSDTEPAPVLSARERGEGLPSAAGAPPASQVITNPTDAVANAIISAATGSSTDSSTAATTSANLAEATFTGGGRYEVYRQGALTWRFDTTTGHSCVLYASDALWYNPSVSAHGCTGDE